MMAAAAAALTGLRLTLLPVLYRWSTFGGAPSTEGQRRFVSDLDLFARLVEGSGAALRDLPGAALGVAPHSLRAVTPEDLAAAAGLAADGPVHIHAAEQAMLAPLMQELERRQDSQRDALAQKGVSENQTALFKDSDSPVGGNPDGDVVVVEFNPTIPNDVVFIQDPDPTLNQGASLRALIELGKAKSYELVAATTCNAVFVDKALFGRFNIADNSIDAMHDLGNLETKFFQLYDGTLMLAGNDRLNWHGLAIDPEKIQVLPKHLRRFPG